MRRMAPGARNEMPDVIVTAPLPSPPFAPCPNVTPLGTRAALHDATIWLSYALSPRSGRHRLLEVITPASTTRLPSRSPPPHRSRLYAAAAAYACFSMGCYRPANLPSLGRAVPWWADFVRYFCSIMAPTFSTRLCQCRGITDGISITPARSTLRPGWTRLAAREL